MPSARPARRFVATPITRPISFIEAAPVSAMMALTSAVSSSGVSCLGRNSCMTLTCASSSPARSARFCCVYIAAESVPCFASLVMILMTSASGNSSTAAPDVLASMIYFLMLRSALRRTASRAFMAAIISLEMVFSNDIASVIYSFTLYLATCFCIFFLIHCLLVAAASLEEGQHAAHEHVAL